MRRSGPISRKRIDALLEALPPEAAAKISKTLPAQKPKGRPPSIDLANKVYGSWHVVMRLPPTPGKPVMWVALCGCGESGTISQSNLTRGLSKQCRTCATVARTKRSLGG